MRYRRHFAALLAGMTLACIADAPLAQDDGEDARIQRLERRIDELEGKLAPMVPPGNLKGSWTGKVSADVPAAECKFVFRPAMDLWLSVDGADVSGEAIGRASMRLVVEIKGHLGADGLWRGHGRGFAAGAWAMDLWFSGDLTAGTGTWRETNYGCRGKLSLSRDE